MCKKIFIAATGQHRGKTTISLALLHLARKKYQRVGFIKPFGPKRTRYRDQFVDIDVALISQVYGMDKALPLMSPVVLDDRTTRDVLDGKADPKRYRDAIFRAVEELEKQCDFLIIEGAGHTGVGSVLDLNNAQLAKQLDAPVLLVAGGGIGRVIDNLQLNLALFRETGAAVRMILPNKLIREKRETTLKYLRLALAQTSIQIVGGFNYLPVLANPTLNHLAELLQLDLHGDSAQGRRVVHQVQLGVASTHQVVEQLGESTLVIVPGQRNEILVMLSTLYPLPGFKDKIAGLIINESAPLDDSDRRVLDDSGIPYMETDRSLTELHTRIGNDVAKIDADDKGKVALIQQLAENELDFNLIDTVF